MAVIVLLGLSLALDGQRAGLVVAFAALLGLGATLWFILGSDSCLTLDSRGFSVRIRGSAQRYDWGDVAEFGFCRLGGREFVGFDFSASYSGSRAPGAAMPAIVRPSFEMVLVDSYRKRATELVSLLNAWKQSHGGA